MRPLAHLLIFLMLLSGPVPALAAAPQAVPAQKRATKAVAPRAQQARPAQVQPSQRKIVAPKGRNLKPQGARAPVKGAQQRPLATLGSQDGTRAVRAGAPASKEITNVTQQKQQTGEQAQGDLLCTSYQVQESVENAQHYMLGTTAALYPGAVLLAGEVLNGNYNPQEGNRGAYSIVYQNGPAIAGNVDVSISQPNLASVQNAINGLVQPIQGAATPARFFWEEVEVLATEQVGAYLGLRYNGGITSAEGLCRLLE